MNKLTTLDWVAFVLVVIGGLNWGLYAFGYALFTGGGTLAKIILVLVALGALYLLVNMNKLSKK